MLIDHIQQDRCRIIRASEFLVIPEEQVNDAILMIKYKQRPLLDALSLHLEFDDEGWMGVSIFVPRDFENETARNGSGGSIEVIVSNTDSSAYFFNVNIFVPAGKTEAHWVLQYVVDDMNVEGASGSKRNFILAPVEGDLDVARLEDQGHVVFLEKRDLLELPLVK